MKSKTRKEFPSYLCPVCNRKSYSINTNPIETCYWCNPNLSPEPEDAKVREAIEMQFDWIFAVLVDGRLIDIENGYECNPAWPSFETVAEAEEWVKENDERVTVSCSEHVRGFQV